MTLSCSKQRRLPIGQRPALPTVCTQQCPVSTAVNLTTWWVFGKFRQPWQYSSKFCHAWVTHPLQQRPGFICLLRHDTCQELCWFIVWLSVCHIHAEYLVKFCHAEIQDTLVKWQDFSTMTHWQTQSANCDRQTTVYISDMFSQPWLCAPSKVTLHNSCMNWYC